MQAPVLEELRDVNDSEVCPSADTRWDHHPHGAVDRGSYPLAVADAMRLYNRWKMVDAYLVGLAHGVGITILVGGLAVWAQ